MLQHMQYYLVVERRVRTVLSSLGSKRHFKALQSGRAASISRLTSSDDQTRCCIYLNGQVCEVTFPLFSVVAVVQRLLSRLAGV